MARIFFMKIDKPNSIMIARLPSDVMDIIISYTDIDTRRVFGILPRRLHHTYDIVLEIPELFVTDDTLCYRVPIENKYMLIYVPEQQQQQDDILQTHNVMHYGDHTIWCLSETNRWFDLSW